MPNLRKKNQPSSSAAVPLPNTILSRYLALPVPSGKCQVTYVWIDGKSGLRSKSRTLNFTAQRVADIPLWSFDGASTYQTPEDPASSDVFLLPVALYNDPFRPACSAKLVLCETVKEDGRTPAGGNTRAECGTTMLRAASADPWFGIEQEYYLLEGEGASGANPRPLGWPAHGTADAPGRNYCGVGAGAVVGRDIVEAHYRACLYAGVALAGENAEAMLSQWEFQIGPCRGVAAADDLWMGRYILYRVAEDFGVGVSLDPKLVPGDGWYGAGAHVNFSTLAMRVSGSGNTPYRGLPESCEATFTSGGIRAIEEAMPLLEANHAAHIAVYDLNGGEDNRRRLTGSRCTAPIDQFSWAVDSRHVSVRIPKLVAQNGHGYFEDRRPASNADPYLVCERLVRTVCLNAME